MASEIHTSAYPLLPALAVDAACSGNPGVMEFRGVIADTGTEVFHRGPFPQGTNNIGEFLALVLGLAYLKQHNGSASAKPNCRARPRTSRCFRW